MPRRIQKEIERGGDTSLDARLSEYSTVARAFHRRTGKWAIYAAATGSALATATGASAGSIVYDIFSSPVSVTPQPLSASSIKALMMGSGHEVNLFAKSGTIGGEPFVELELQPINPVKIFLTGAGTSAKDFALGAAIGGTQMGEQAIIEDFFTATFFGQFQSGKAGFAGLSFSTAGHQHEYGWIELSFTEQGGRPYSLDALGFGVDTTPGQTIDAGQISNSPEPGTLGLAILAAGAVGVEALRRRRKQA
jgi:hypothetical protein